MFNSWSISDKLFNWIRTNLKVGSTILELGSGQGTIELSKHYKMISIEHNPFYLNPGENRQFIYAPIADYEGYRWYDKKYIIKKIPNYDLFLIDGPPGDIGRLGVYYNMELFNWDVPVIVDDTHRVQEEILSNLIMNNIKEHKKPIIISDMNRLTDIYL